MDIKKINQFNTITLMHNIKHKNIKCNFSLDKVEDVQRKFLRNILNFRPRFFRKQKCKNSILSNGVMIYNKIPGDLREMNGKSFKKNLKKFLINNEID